MTIKERNLSSFATLKSSKLFKHLKISTTFLKEDPHAWVEIESHQLGKKAVDSLTVVNDHAERGVALIQEYSGLLTKDEQQLQFVMQVVTEHRKQYPDAEKKTLVN